MRYVFWSGAVLAVVFILVSSVSAPAKGNLVLPKLWPPDKPAPSAPAAPTPKSTAPDQSISVTNIAPLYTEPKMPGEGVWVKQDVLGDDNTEPLIYRTFYRPSEQFPNAIAYMLLFNMKRISAKLYLGTSEPCRKKSHAGPQPVDRTHLLAITNALWQSRHAGKGGIIYRGEVLKKMAPGVAAMVLYKDGSIDIRKWSDDIPVPQVQDARQLMHLIVAHGKVVTTIVKRGKVVSGEIGLGSLLNETRPVITVPASSPDGKPSTQLNLTSGRLWFLATRSAFGIRPDGNLVFAVGHHIGTCDLAKALVLAGCVRAIHGDSNPGNAVGILYFRDDTGKIVRKVRLSPQQDRSTLNRYLNGGYPKDFFAFYRR